MSARLIPLLVILAVGCGDNNSSSTQQSARQVAQPRSSGPVDSADGVVIGKSEYGDDWPYSVESGRLYCDPPGSNVVLEADGRVYALNGRALGNATERGYLDARETITLRDEHGYFTIGDTQRIISRGLAMCR